MVLSHFPDSICLAEMRSTTRSLSANGARGRQVTATERQAGWTSSAANPSAGSSYANRYGTVSNGFRGRTDIFLGQRPRSAFGHNRKRYRPMTPTGEVKEQRQRIFVEFPGPQLSGLRTVLLNK